MQRIIPLFITSIHDPQGVTRRGAIANLSDIVSITDRSPAELYKVTEDQYQRLLKELRPVISKAKLSDNDRSAIGELVARFQENLKNFSPDFGLEVVNLHQAVAEDLGKDINTIETYLILSDARRNNPHLPQGSPDEIVMSTLRAAGKPMTPRQIAAASGVNYNTIRRVVQELLREGKITRGTLRGSYVTKTTSTN